MGANVMEKSDVKTAPVPFADLSIQYRQIKEEVLREIAEVGEGCSFILGPKVAAFEKAFAEYQRVKHCVAVNSGTSALHLALICAGVGRDDEVITVPMTFVATSWGISYCGAKPVFVDVDPVTYCMDPALVEKAITKKTKAILPVHLYGQMADMPALLEIGKKHGIPVIEDAAQAHGAELDGKRAGHFGQTTCFSFYPGKNLGAYGEGGAVVTNDDAIATRLKRLRDHAQGQRYHHDEIGYNYRMDGYQGAVLGVKLKHLDKWTDLRGLRAGNYGERLKGLPLQLPRKLANRRHAWHLYVALHQDRDGLRTKLEAKGVQSGLHYPVPVHLQKAYADLGHNRGDFPVTEKVASQCVTLPLFPEMTDEQQNRVVEALTEVLK